MTTILCRHEVEAGFESLIARFVKPNITVSISNNDRVEKDTENEIKTQPSVKPSSVKPSSVEQPTVEPSSVEPSTVEPSSIEQIVDFYVIYEKHIDTEGMFRAFLIAVHYAVDDESAKLSRWLYRVRPTLISIINPKLMVQILSRKLDSMLEYTESKFMSEYFVWLVECYCEQNNKTNNRSMLTLLVKRINRKMVILAKSKKDPPMTYGSIAKGFGVDAETSNSFPKLQIYTKDVLIANLILTTYGSLSRLYEKNK